MSALPPSFGRGKHPLALKDLSDFLERGFDVGLWKSYLPKPFNVAEFLAPYFQHNNGSSEAEPPLEQSSLMNDVHASA